MVMSGLVNTALVEQNKIGVMASGRYFFFIQCLITA